MCGKQIGKPKMTDSDTENDTSGLSELFSDMIRMKRGEADECKMPADLRKEW